MSGAIEDIRNIGPKTARMLVQAGFSNACAIKDIGAVGAYIRLCFHYPDRVSINALWALYAGLEGRDWRDLHADEKASLKDQLKAIKQGE